MMLKIQTPTVSSELNINYKFLRPDRDSYYIDYPSIIANEKTITKGTTYALFNSRDNNITMTMVQITDAYYDGYVLSLILKDVESKGAGINVEFDIFKEPSKCTWLLIDLPFLQEKIDVLNVNNFCGCK
jgi:hypothetical protein